MLYNIKLIFMNINKLSKIIQKKISKEINYQSLDIQDKTYLHIKHETHTKGKYHIKLILKSDELSKMNKLSSTRKVYKILNEEINIYIHSIQIELI
tara:strand:+ start:409 stop:696 length:288 start_codon:yes stop_codon:yes gene_type:complete